MNIFLLLLSIALLWKGADYLVESASAIAAKFGISDLVIGLTVVALGTSAPEMAVTVSASLNNQAAISIGNIVGSNIFNTGFILGSIAMIAGVKTTRTMIYRDGLFMLLVSLLLLFFLRDLKLEFYESLIFLVMLGLYLAYLFVKKETLEENIVKHEVRVVDYFILPASIAAVVSGGHFLVDSASFIARAAGVSDWIIGVTIVAMGTSAPEMATSLTAVLKGKDGMSAGNLIGSNLFNILGVLGLAGAIRDLTLKKEALVSLIILCVLAVVLLVMAKTKFRISRREGIILVLLSLASYVIIISGWGNLSSYL